jgi:chloride channel protein, CIC family
MSDQPDEDRQILKTKRNLMDLFHWFEKISLPEPASIVFTAMIVGAGAGLGAVFFRWLIASMQTLSYDVLGNFLGGIKPYHLLIIPALGGAVYGPLIYRYAREAKGHGVPEVMEAVALRGGRIRPRVAIIKSLASAICIGTGGSIGREGPIAQIGSALGSTIGQWLNLSNDRIRSLVACGAAGGIAATFNAPIAGSIFSLEIILGQFQATYFGAVVISAVTANVVAQAFEGSVRAFVIPEYILVSPWELLFYVLLGLIAAVLGAAFTRLLYISEDLFEKLPFPPEYFKPILGGFILGVIGLISFKVDGFPRVFGVGYDSIGEALFGKLALQVTFGLLVLKFLATIVTLGAGGSGGIFAPSLFMGAMLGEAFGQIMNMVFPNITAPPGAYALVGMSAFFSSAAHAPITAVLILFEMTGDYLIILPLMLTTVIGTLVSRIISKESVYTMKLTRRGISLQRGRDVDVMETLFVKEVMRPAPDPVPASLPLGKVSILLDRVRMHGLPVMDKDDGLIGVISIRDIDHATIQSEDNLAKPVVDFCSRNLVWTNPNETVGTALKRMSQRDIGRLPVVDPDNPKKLIGWISRADIIRAYERALTRRVAMQQQINQVRLGTVAGVQIVEESVKAGCSAEAQPLCDIHWPEDSLVASIQRGSQVLIPHGNTLLQAGDRLTIICQHGEEEILARLLSPVPEEKKEPLEKPVESAESTDRV